MWAFIHRILVDFVNCIFDDWQKWNTFYSFIFIAVVSNRKATGFCPAALNTPMLTWNINCVWVKIVGNIFCLVTHVLSYTVKFWYSNFVLRCLKCFGWNKELLRFVLAISSEIVGNRDNSEKWRKSTRSSFF